MEGGTGKRGQEEEATEQINLDNYSYSQIAY